MRQDEILQKIVNFCQKNLLVVILCTAGLICLSIGMIQFLGKSTETQGLSFETESQASDSAKIETQISVDVEGAVAAPGVYRLLKDQRVQDALIKASGLSQKADQRWVSKNLNLAAKLSDGAKIYIPFEGETSTNNSVFGVNSQTSSLSPGTININSASLSELDSLSGIGPVTAQKIIDNRPYTSIQELLERKIVSQKVFEKMKEKITVN